LITNQNRKNLNIVAEGRILPSPKEVFQIFSTFVLTCIAWIFFRATNVTEAFLYIKGIFSASILSLPDTQYLMLLPWIFIFLAIEWLQRGKAHPLMLDNINVYLRWSIYFVMFFITWKDFFANKSGFIYFQF
jgi:alginate O-acetyltransferase complex protein AlgI